MMRQRDYEASDESWRERALCLNLDPDMFFPFPEADQKTIAISICGKCAVRAECLDFALATRQEYGVWGGATEKERKLMLKTGYIVPRRGA